MSERDFSEKIIDKGTEFIRRKTKPLIAVGATSIAASFLGEEVGSKVILDGEAAGFALTYVAVSYSRIDYGLKKIGSKIARTFRKDDKE